MNDKFKRDYFQQTGLKYSGGVLLRLLKHQSLRYIYLGRLLESSKSRLIDCICILLQRRITNRCGIEIDFKSRNIGEGFVLMHGFDITVNPQAKLGQDVVLFKGCTIGSVRSGKRAGVPRIGSRVVIATNAMVCGGITVGNDVLIAANSFVDFDVPDHSLVIGNPARIFSKVDAAKDYLRRE